MQTESLPARIILGVLLCCVSPIALGAAEPSVSAESAPMESPSDDAIDSDLPAVDDELDQLLNLAEQDVGRLSQVDVSAAPALQEVVSTVARRESTVGRSPAAVFVVTNEMIRRSGARSIPEVLRMVPGVQVARIDASKWAVSIRGFNNRFSNKLLVQIDGRTVYTPLFAGVFWDVQQVLLEDVERIEVIRGPGATLWGANAVNGIINIITKHAADTQGVYLENGGGTERAFSNARYGGQIGDDAFYRVYGQWFEVDKAFDPAGNAHDDWRMGRGGFRLDWEPDYGDHVTLQGDYYDGYTGRQNLVPSPQPPAFVSRINDDAHVSGGNVLLRFHRELSDDSDWSLQMYYDRTERHFIATRFLEDRDTFDVDFQHRFPWGNRHSFLWGLGVRTTDDVTRDSPFIIRLDPPERTVNLYSAFLQDEVTLVEDSLFLTVGSKFLENDYTGFELQPTARLLWAPNERYSFWSAISRAVRLPSRAEDDIAVRLLPELIPPPAAAPPGFPPTPVFPIVTGNRNFDSETLTAYEIGLRGQPIPEFSWDVATFLHDYNGLTATAPGVPSFAPPFPTVPLHIVNGIDGQAYGFELAANYQLTERWKLYGAYTFLRLSLDPDAGTAPNTEVTEGESPRNQFYLQSSWDVRCNVQFDLIGRYTDHLPSFGIPSYFVMDARLAWRPTAELELAVVGRHFLDSSHPEFGLDTYTGNVATEVQEEVFATVIWRY